MRALFSFLPEPWSIYATAIVIAGLFITFIAFSVMFFIWLERKVSARIQDRLGPTRTGGKFGWAQSIADTLKLVSKEDAIPKHADRFLFRLAPYIAFCASFVSFVALPFSKDLVGYEMNVAAFFMLSVLSSEVFGVILAGYASGSKWSLFGGIREAAQVVSYEVPRAISVLIPIIVAGTLNLNIIGQQQVGGFWNWNLFHDPFCFASFWIFFICATASCKRAPFDLAEAESELVAGFHTEYSGVRWSYFFMTEYASMFAVSGLASLLFLGGWHCGFLPFEPSIEWGLFGHFFNLGVFILKAWFLIFVMMWMRWSLPRLRIDQVMTTCLQYFLPLSCVMLLGICLWELMAQEWMELSWRYLSASMFILFIGNTIYRVLRSPLTTPRAKLPGVWTEWQSPLNKSSKQLSESK